MYEYVHGGDVYSLEQRLGIEDILDFSANINPLGLPEAVITAIQNNLAKCDQYPDPFCRKLVAALAEYEHTASENIFCANGASEIIFRLVLARKPKQALLLAPTFADYEKALKSVDCQIKYYYLSPEHDFCVREDLLEQINDDIEMVFLCNPNNPTGQVCDRAFIEQVLEKCWQTRAVVVVDECFMDFIEQKDDCTAQIFLNQYSNLVILKAFTKIYAMAGIRLGYALTANHHLMGRIYQVGQDWAVSTIAQTAGVVALQQKEYLSQTKTLIQREREFLINSLQSLGFNVIGSKANYIFFQTSIFSLDRKLLTKGIMIRCCGNYVNLTGEYYRIAVKKRNDNLRLMAAIKDVINCETADGDN